jgi:2-alkyl-3-oxoalkanoate reductase
MSNRLRTEGADHLLSAAKEAGVKRLVAQSFCGWPYARIGGPVKSEDDPLDPDPPKEFRRTLDAIRYLEGAVVGAGFR